MRHLMVSLRMSFKFGGCTVMRILRWFGPAGRKGARRQYAFCGPEKHGRFESSSSLSLELTLSSSACREEARLVSSACKGILVQQANEQLAAQTLRRVGSRLSSSVREPAPSESSLSLSPVLGPVPGARSAASLLQLVRWYCRGVRVVCWYGRGVLRLVSPSNWTA